MCSTDGDHLILFSAIAYCYQTTSYEIASSETTGSETISMETTGTETITKQLLHCV